MPGLERPVDRGARLGRSHLQRLGAELRECRLDRGLAIDVVAAAVGLSNAEISRVERGLSPKVPFINLVRVAAAIGMDLSARLFPGGPPIRDVAHLRLLGDFRASLHRALGWSSEVPLPIRGDQRAWDATIRGSGWLYGVEVETSPRDAQALVRRLTLKQRDGGVDGVCLVLRDTRGVRTFLREAADELAGAFPISGARAIELLRAGVNPGGSSVVLVPRRSHRPTGPTTVPALSARRLARVGRPSIAPHV